MIIVRPQDVLHKFQLLKLLVEILDNPILSSSLYFKGGTCASMLGMLDRFSVDLDFDTKLGADEILLRSEFHQIFKKLDLLIKDESKAALEFFVKYPAPDNQRSIIKVDALNLHVKANKYAPQFLPEIDRTAACQTKETIFANKLVALKDRYDRNGSIAGRDVFDIHHFFLKGFSYNRNVIEERTKKTVLEFFKDLEIFIETKITSTIIDQDLNTLLPNTIFQKIRKTLKQETLMFLKQEITTHLEQSHKT